MTAVIYSELEQVLQHTLTDRTAVVALLDEERAQIHRAHVAKILKGERSECFQRLVWPVLNTSAFVWGPAPTGRTQYVVRCYANLRIEVEIEPLRPLEVGDYVTLPHLIIDQGGRWCGPPLHEDPITTWAFDPASPPPGYPVTTRGEALARGRHARPSDSLARHAAGRAYARLCRESVERRVDAQLRAAARDGEFLARERREERAAAREQEAREQLANLLATAPQEAPRDGEP